MSLDERSTVLLSQLVHAESFITMDEIIGKLGISRRTVYYDIKKINNWLADYNLQPVKYVQSAGFLLAEEAKQEIPAKITKVKKWHYGYSKKERISWLAIYLLTSNSAIFLYDLSEKIRVSRSTTIADCKLLQQELESFQLSLSFHRSHGYQVNGRELDQRKALFYYLSQVMSNKGWDSFVQQIQVMLNSDEEKAEATGEPSPELFNRSKLAKMYDFVLHCEQELSIQLTDDTIHNFALRLYVISKRIKQGKHVQIDSAEKQALQSTKEYLAAFHLAQRIGDLLELEMPESEICYITMNLLGAKTNELHPDWSTDEEINRLKTVIINMVDDFERLACVTFQNRQLVETNLMIHLKPAYYRLKYGLSIDNPLAVAVKEKYPEIFQLTKRVVYHFEEIVSKQVGEEETAFIAIHFGGALKREGTTIIRPKTALIVCPNGIGTSQILKTQLERLFPTIHITEMVSSREYTKNEYDVDVIFSTVPIQQRSQPVFLISSILTEREKQSLLKKVQAVTTDHQGRNRVDGLLEIIKNHATIHNESGLLKELSIYLQQDKPLVRELRKPMLNELIQSDTILQIKQVTDWKEGIRVAAQPLLANGTITDLYVETMITNVEQLGPYIVVAPHVAIPHARPDQGVNKLGMSLLCLEQPVLFANSSEHSVSLIIVLAALNNETHLKALSQLSDLISDEENIDKLIKAKDKQEILAIVQQYSN